MFRIILIIVTALPLLHFTDSPITSQYAKETEAVLDTVPVKVDEALIRELIGDVTEKTWRDSGYYFQVELVSWRVLRLGTTANGDIVMLSSFSSADPASLQFSGQAVFRFDPDKWPEGITPAKGLQGQALLTFPQDVLFCPSPSQEVGLGQNDPYFPLYLSGEITGVFTAPSGDLVPTTTAISVQLRDFEVIM